MALRPTTQSDCYPTATTTRYGLPFAPSTRASYTLETERPWFRGGGTEDPEAVPCFSGASPHWPRIDVYLDGTTVVTSVAWVPDMGFVASSPAFPFMILSLDGITWSALPANLSLGQYDMVTLGNRVYAIEATIRPRGSVYDSRGTGGGGIIGTFSYNAITYSCSLIQNPQLVVSTAETYPDFYQTETMFDVMPHLVNGWVSDGKYMYLVGSGTTLNRVPILPPYDPRSASLPSDPTDVEVGSENTHQMAVVSWTAPDTGGTSTITEYVMQVTEDAGLTWTLLPTTAPSLLLTRTITGLTNGKSYMFRVAAVNDSGRGPFSLPSAPYIPRPTPPSPPSSVTATPVGPQELAWVGGTRGSYNVRLRIDWTQSGDGGSPVTGYIIKRFPYDLEVGRLTSASTTFTTDPTATVRVFSPGDSVQFQVIAINASGESAPSTPSAPVILR